MRDLPRISLIAVLAIGAATAGAAAVVDSSLAQFDLSVRDYNLISFGNASFTNYGDTEGGLAVAGNLFLDGGAVANVVGAAGLSNDPSLYLGGALSTNGTAYLKNGYAAISAAANPGWSWNAQQNRLQQNGSIFSTINSADPLGDIDPRLNPAPLGFDFATLRTDFVGISQALAASTASGQIQIAGQTLRFAANDADAHGAIVFDLDANLLVGNTYGGQLFSNIQFDVPLSQAFVINVRNAAGRSLFGSTGINFNKGSGYEHLLWNIVDNTQNTTEAVRFGNGGQFFGAVLAPTFDVFNDLGTAINGQVVAGSYTHTGAELHFTAFEFHEEFDYQVPEPGTYGLIGALACVGLVLHRRRRAAAVVNG